MRDIYFYKQPADLLINKTTMQLAMNISATATKTTLYLQAKYKCAGENIPALAEINLNVLRPLLRQAPNVPKDCLVGKQDGVGGDVECSDG